MTDQTDDNIPTMDEVVVTPTPIPEEAVAKETPAPETVKNFVVDIPVFEDTKWDPSSEIVDLPSDIGTKMNEALVKAPNQTYKPDWVGAIREGAENGMMQDAFQPAVDKENSLYNQGIAAPSGVLRGAEPRFTEMKNQSLTGDSAVLRALSHRGLGTMFQIPLWHTGIWLTVRAPSESQLLELQRQLISDKISFGRQTYGLIYSNTTAYTVDRLVNFVIQNLHSSTLKDPGDLREVISSHDMPALVWGLSCAIYPKGFQYRRACMCDPAKCNHVVEERLNLTKIQWTNTRSLTAGQIAHMTNRRIASMSKESVLNYQKELLDCQTREVTIDPDTSGAMKITMRIPTLAEYIDSGHRWVGDIVTMVNKTIGMDADEDSRNEYIFNQGQSTSLRQYAHWISSIGLGENIIEGKEDIERVLGQLSTDDAFRDSVMEKLKDYIAATAISLIGIPTYECPECGKTQKSSSPYNTSIIPLDTIQVFFTLLVQKIQRLKVR